MKRNILLSIFICVIISFAIFNIFIVNTGVCDSNKRVIKTGFTNNRPLNYIDEAGEKSGYNYELLKTIAKRENWELEYVEASWNECLKMLQEGKIDIMGTVSQTEERESVFDFSNEPMIVEWGTVLVRKGIEFRSYNDIRGTNIALFKGENQGEYFLKEFNAIVYNWNPVYCESIEEIKKAIKEKRVDYIVINNNSALEILNVKGVKETGLIFNPVASYFAVTKGNNAELLKRIDENLLFFKAMKNPLTEKLRIKYYSHSFIKIHKYVLYILIVLCVLSIIVFIFVISLKHQVKIQLETIKGKNEELEIMANTDVLTGLKNRYSFIKKAGNVFEEYSQGIRNIAIIIADIDGFKTINDTYGHVAGDDILKEVANRISGNIKCIDYVARIGGDEFAIVIYQEDESEIKRILENIDNDIEEINLSNVNRKITISSGYTFINLSDENFEEVLIRADQAMYFAKKAKKQIEYNR